MKPRIDIEILREQLPYYQHWEKKRDKSPPGLAGGMGRFDAKKLFDFDLAAIPEPSSWPCASARTVSWTAIMLRSRFDEIGGWSLWLSHNTFHTHRRGLRSRFCKCVKNLFGHELMYFQPSDELSAIAAVEAIASQGGVMWIIPHPRVWCLKTKNLFPLPVSGCRWS